MTDAERPSGRKPATDGQRSPRRSQPGGIADELEPYVDRKDAGAINQLGRRMQRERPLPTPGFKAELRARLAERRGARGAWRPANLGRLVAAYAGSGLVLLAVAAIGLTGAGPLGY